MNLLAHALLSPDEPGVLVGNLTADWIKGKTRLTLPEDLQRGFALHRTIDAFTDTHPLVEHASNLLSTRWNRYAPVLTDIFFDHLLTVDWQRYTPRHRPAFIRQTYTTLQAHVHKVPERAQFGVHALVADDWFSCYASMDGLALSLSRLSARLNHQVELAPAVADFQAHFREFTRVFAEFFPQLAAHVARQHPSMCAA